MACIIKACADHYVPVTLELGGKDPLIIFDDAEFEQAATICMRATFWNAGQNCISAERIYVQDGVYDRFVQWVTPRIKALRQGECSLPVFAVLGDSICNRLRHARHVRYWRVWDTQAG
jgi:acyl-CoA reductase-like NAD-dependent aldehyde dehydrogenase